MKYILVRNDGAIWFQQFNTFAVARQAADKMNLRSNPYFYDVYQIDKAQDTSHREPEVDDGRLAYE